VLTNKKAVALGWGNCFFLLAGGMGQSGKQGHGGVGVCYFDNEALVLLVFQLYHNGIFVVPHIDKGAGPL
jgi:hypothetical protein